MGRNKAFAETLKAVAIGLVTVFLTIVFDLMRLRFTVGTSDPSIMDPSVLAFEYRAFSVEYDVLLISLGLLLTAMFSPLADRGPLSWAWMAFWFSTAAIVFLGTIWPAPDTWLELALPFIVGVITIIVSVHTVRLAS